MLGPIKNARIAAKIFISPLILVVSILALGLVFHLAMNRQETAMERMVTVSFANSRAAAQLDGMAASIQSNLYRLLGWQAAREDKDKIQALEKQLRGDIKTLAERSKTVFDALGADAASAKQVKDYGLAAGDVLDIFASDPITALSMMGSTEVEYDGLQKLLDGLADQAAARASEDYAETTALAGTARVEYFGVLSLALILGVAVTLAMSRLIAGPVTGLTAVMGRLAGGGTDLEIPSREAHDEIGAMARAVAVFRDGLEKAARLEAEQAEQRRRQERLMAHRDALIAGFNATMETILGAVGQSIDHVHKASVSLQSTAEETSRQGAAVAKAAELSASNVATVASAAEQLGGSVREISRQVAETTTITTEAVQGIHAANTTMDGLADAASRIGEVVTLINDIASQTNLLALNATIEAARAGEAGKGFAVVAAEVKTLANQTAKATDEIAQQISGIQDISREAAETIRTVGLTIDRVNQVVASIAAAVEQQTAATGEIVRSVQQASDGNAEITRNIADVSRAAGATGDMATGMFRAADELVQESGSLRSEVSGFLRAMGEA